MNHRESRPTTGAAPETSASKSISMVNVLADGCPGCGVRPVPLNRAARRALRRQGKTPGDVGRVMLQHRANCPHNAHRAHGPEDAAREVAAQ